MQKHTINKNQYANKTVLLNGLLISRYCRITALAAQAIIIFFCLSAAWAQDISQELKVDHKVIMILQNEGLFPNVAIVERGTTVIWINHAVDPMEIKFSKGEVKTACRQPINFYTDKNGNYRSNKLATGAVASLCFIEKGEFEYQLERSKGEWAEVDTKRLKGIVRVH